jgi:hypothetical protein
MHHVALDTDVLRQDPQRRGAAARRLQQLIDEGHVRLHIPDIVRREFLSAVTADYRKRLSEAEESLKEIRADFLGKAALDLRQKLRQLRRDVADMWQHEFDAWCRRANTLIHPPPSAQLQTIVNAYFEGSGPFRSAKSRVDFPDALIWATVVDLASDVGELHFIVRDSTLAKAAADVSGVKRYASIDEFLLSTYEELSTRIDGRLFELLFANVKLLEGWASSELRYHLPWMTIQSERFPTGEALIADGETTLDVFARLPQAENLGGGYFRFPFGGEGEIDIDYEVSYGDWVEEDPNDKPTENEGDDDDTVEQVRVSTQVVIEGILEVHVPYTLQAGNRYLTNEDLRRAMYTAEYEILELAVVNVGELD